jgi:large subunit ribosomal protein L11e
MDFYVNLSRRGYRISKRKLKRKKVGFPHKIKKEDSMKWFIQKYEGIIM